MDVPSQTSASSGERSNAMATPIARSSPATAIFPAPAIIVVGATVY